jgi:hypothetical protein
MHKDDLIKNMKILIVHNIHIYVREHVIYVCVCKYIYYLMANKNKKA